MDYDTTDIPAAYDRGRDHGPSVLHLWMNVVSSHVERESIQTILDLGCGTGRFSEALAIHFEADVIGIDPSSKMLEQARRKQRHPRVHYELGSGEAIPLADHSVDLIFMSMVFHHFNDPAHAARECHRVLRDGGIAFLRAGTRERIESYPYVSFFPESRSILHECLTTTSHLREVFESAGFSIVTSDLVAQEIAPNYAAYAEKLSAGADSVLARLNPGDFEAGLEAMRSYTVRNANQPVCEIIDVLTFRSQEHGGARRNTTSRRRGGAS
jgi:ubiquinone/menaquinone biosynthesis C-methylase UbiE